MFSFDGISSKFAPLYLYSCVEYATDSVRQIGLSGGIVPVPAECKSNDLARGVGVTVYHLVENIEAVRLLIFMMGVCLIKTQIEKKVGELGGTAVTGKEPEGKNAWFMHLKDIEGNRFAIYETRKQVRCM